MTTMITHIKFNTKIAVILIVAGTIGLMAGPARAEITSWTDNGDGINWNDALNWDNGVPDATKDVVIGNTTVNRIISVTATTNIVQGAVPAAGYRTLTIDQTTAGVTNQLKLDVAMGGFLNNTYPSFTGGGAIILNLNGKQWLADAGAGAAATTFTLTSNVTLLSGSGGKLLGAYYEYGSAAMNLVVQGQAAWSDGAGGTANNGITTIDTTGTLSVTNNAQYIAGATIGFGDSGAKLISKGTLTGDSTGSIYARTLQLDPDSTLSGLATLTTGIFDLRTTNPAAINLSATTLQNPNAGGTAQTIEVGANATGSYLVSKLGVRGGASRVTLVDNYDNDLSSAAAERLEVNTLELGGGATPVSWTSTVRA